MAEHQRTGLNVSLKRPDRQPGPKLLRRELHSVTRAGGPSCRDLPLAGTFRGAPVFGRASTLPMRFRNFRVKFLVPSLIKRSRQPRGRDYVRTLHGGAALRRRAAGATPPVLCGVDGTSPEIGDAGSTVALQII